MLKKLDPIKTFLTLVFSQNNSENQKKWLSKWLDFEVWRILEVEP